MSSRPPPWALAPDVKQLLLDRVESSGEDIEDVVNDALRAFLKKGPATVKPRKVWIEPVNLGRLLGDLQRNLNDAWADESL